MYVGFQELEVSMNCEKGDIAYIKCRPYIGHLVSILSYCGPGEVVVLPDGVESYGDGWVCEKANGLFSVKMDSGEERQSKYAVIDDSVLRAIRDQPGQDEMLRVAGKPKNNLLDECNILIERFNRLAEFAKEYKK